MRAAVFALVLSIGLLLPLPWTGPAGASDREWPVSGPENVSNRTFFVEENITVGAGGRLALDNSTILFNSTEGSPLVLEVKAGGELVMRDSTLNSNGSGPYLVRALPGSKLTVSGCTVSRAGTCATEPELSGFLVATDLARIDNSTFQDGAAGMYVWNCSTALSGCRYLANEIGAVMDAARVDLEQCRFASQNIRDLFILNGSSAVAVNSYLDASGVVVEDIATSLDIVWSLSVTVAWDTGLPAAGAMVTIKDAYGDAKPYQANQSGVATGLPVRQARLVRSGGLHYGPFNISAESGGKAAWVLADIDDRTDMRLTLDGTPPEVAIDHPAEGARLNGTPRPASGTARDAFPAEDSPGILLVEARLDGGPWAAADGTGDWSFALSGLSEGLHTLGVRAWDLAGNSNQSSVGFEIDLTPPSLEAWPPAGYLTSARNLTVRISTDGDAVLFNGTPLPAPAPGQPLEADWPLDVEGENRAEVSSLDEAGNSARLELRVVRDTTPPEVVFTSPAAYSVHSTPLVTVTGRSSDLHGVVLVEWGADRRNWTLVNGTGEWSFPVLLAEGENTVYVRATDGAGVVNIAWLRLDLRSPDTTPPEVRILFPGDGQAVSSPGLDVTVRAFDAGSVRSVQLSLDGANWTNASLAGDWNGRLTLSPGNNTVRARAFDQSGNVNSTHVRVIYNPPPPDRAPPSLVVLYPPAGLKVPHGKLVVSGRASDPSGVSSVEISTDGRGWTPCILTGEDWSGTLTLGPGANTILVRATDGAGNRAEASVKAVYQRPEDPAAGRTTVSLVLVLVALALLAVWLLARAPHRPGRAGAEEE